MATTKKPSAPAPVVVAAKKAAALVTTKPKIVYAEDAGAGMAGIDADSVAIPFLAVLQKMSPQCDPDSPEYMAKAKPGMLINTVTKELFDGKDGVTIVPCNFARKFLRWTPREKGGGFKGELNITEVHALRANGGLIEQDNRLYVPDDHGNVNPKVNDKVADTRVHYVLVLNARSGMAQQAVLSLASTQIKKSKQLNSLIRGVEVDRGDGTKVNPASYANLVRISTVPEQNDQGSWSGVAFALEGLVEDAATYQMAKAFSRLVDSGRAVVNFDAADGEDEPGAPKARRF